MEPEDDPAPSYTEDELNSMTKAELLVIVEELGISGVTSNSLKADIINAILNA